MSLPVRISVLLSLALALAACGSPTPESPTISLAVSGMQFQPASLEIKAGQPIRLVFTNNDALEHDFSITEFPLTGAVETDGGHDMGAETAPADLHVGAVANSTGAIEFTPSEAGTYEFFCAVAGHKAAGMVGTLVVTAP